MSKFEQKQYLLDRPAQSPVFYDAWNLAGSQLQQQFLLFNKANIVSSFDGFMWIKSQLTYPSYDDLSFAYKGSIFCVLIQLIYDTGVTYNRRAKQEFITFCKEHNLIPCLFRVKLRKTVNNVHKGVLTNYMQDEYDIEACESDWNLVRAVDNKKINPIIASSSEQTRMSNWELHNFAIQVVRDAIVKDGNQLLSYCDVLEINPQIWFKDKKGNIAWVVVKHVTVESDLDYQEWVGLERQNNVLLQYDGYFASVQFRSPNTESMHDLFRGDFVTVNYRGLERIYVS